MTRRHSDSRNWKARLSCLAFPLFLAPGLIHAEATLTVSPVRVELSKARGTAVLTLRNDGDSLTVVQAQVMTWSQQDGADRFADTNDILVSPPLFNLAAGATQIIRLGLRRAPDLSKELTYRLFLQEVPSAAQAAQQTVRMALRISMPVFVDAVDPKPPRLVWRAHRESTGLLRVSVENAGPKHVLLFDLRAGAPGTEVVPLAAKGPQYVLTGQQRSWLTRPADGAAWDAPRVRIRAKSDAGDVDTEIALALP